MVRWTQRNEVVEVIYDSDLGFIGEFRNSLFVGYINMFGVATRKARLWTTTPFVKDAGSSLD